GWGFSGAESAAGETTSPLPNLRVLHVTVEDGRVALVLADAEPPRRFALAGVSLDAGFAMDSHTIHIDVETLRGVPRGLDLSPLFSRGSRTVAATGDDVRVEGLELATRRSRLEGAIQVTTGRQVRARLDMSPLAARELRAVIPEVSLGPDVEGTVVARGPWRRIAARAALR